MRYEQGIFYVMSGPAHLPYFVVSLWTLRQHYEGLVRVYSWSESHDLLLQIQEDSRLDFDLIEHEPRLRKCDGVGSNSQFLDKIDIAQTLPNEYIWTYLDADTTIHAYIDDLFINGERYGFCATQWNDWITSNGHAARRIRELRNVKEVPQDLVDQLLANGWPSVNGGVWSCKPSSPVLPLWYQLTRACGSMFIADEKILHLMLPKFYYDNQSTVLIGGCWNCSPKYQPENLSDKDVIIRHYHGDSNVRPDNKSQKGYNLWWPFYQECLTQRVGCMDEWHGSVGNRWLNKLEKG